MAKTLAGVLAVSIAALLFAGCGGGSSSAPMTTEVSTTTTVAIDYGAQYLAIVAPVNSAQRTYQEKLPGISASDSVAVEAATTPYAEAVELFGNTLLRSSWPEAAKQAITQLAQNAMQQASLLRTLKDAKPFQYASISDTSKRLQGEQAGYASTVRALLNLPPPS
ncbi:MAG: hypothetical protein F2567_08810 [Actinobacteria bacterium]|uniref:Unannotated protein n=1 Tax=freshwater metagenome TaxID=449393 RepID=A0A6J5ZYV0_9ZZZZ|nr:hypothetical protein [Actinomycetota bacterium]MTA43121.1 hypothetical protein [Actinomycetota bacterium]